MKNKLTGRTVAILGLSLLAMLASRPGSAWGATLHYGPWLIPWDKDASKMIILVETGHDVPDDHNHRQIHFTYDATTCGEPNWSWSATTIYGHWIWDVRRLFRIEVTNLNPGHYYEFTFSYKNLGQSDFDKVSGGFMATRNMSSPYPYHVEFLALGDNRGETGGDVPYLIRWCLADAHDTYNFNPEFMVHTGDMVFNGGDLLDEYFYDVWGDDFLGYDPWRWLLKRYPIMAALGNHDFDVENHSGQDKDWADMTNFHTYFPYPHAPGGGVGDSYTYNVNGQAWFFTLDTFPMWGCYCCACDGLKPDSDQFKWLVETLSSIENDPRQWKIVLMHAPLYSPGDCNLHETNSELEFFLEAYGVDLVLTGHEHYYSRKTVPTSSGPNPDIVHLLLGGAGASLSDWNNSTGYNRVLKIYHFANIRIEGDVLQGNVVSADDGDSFKRGDIVDSFTINRAPNADFIDFRSGQRVYFIDQSKGHRYQYLWDFGDGQTASEKNPIHTYSDPGTYDVTLTIKSLWNQSSKTKNITVNNIPNVSELARIEVTPPEANLQVGQQQLFTAKGYDADNNHVPFTAVWRTTGGTIDSTGLYTALGGVILP